MLRPAPPHLSVEAPSRTPMEIQAPDALTTLLVFAVFLAMSLQMRRNIAQFALVCAPLAVASLASPHAARTGAIGSIRRYVAGAASVVCAGMSIWWIVGIVDGRFYFVERRFTREFGVGYCDRVFNNEAAAWLAGQSEIQPELFVDYNSSSNALLHIAGRFQ